MPTPQRFPTASNAFRELMAIRAAAPLPADEVSIGGADPFFFARRSASARYPHRLLAARGVAAKRSLGGCGPGRRQKLSIDARRGRRHLPVRRGRRPCYAPTTGNTGPSPSRRP